MSQQNANTMGVGAGGVPGMMMQSPFQMVSSGVGGANSMAAAGGEAENQSMRGADNFYAQSKIAAASQ